MAPPSAPRTGAAGGGEATAAPPAGPRPGKKKPRPEKKKKRAPREAAARPAQRPARRRGGRGLPFLIGTIAVLAVASTSGGVYAALTTEPTAEASGPAQRTAPGVPPGDPVNVATGGQVAPLRRVVPPDVLAVGTGSIPAAKIKRIARLGRVKDVMAVAGGAVQLQGRQVNAFAVDPSAYRSWTPPGTAKKTELWGALAGNRFVVSPAAAEQLQLTRGYEYPVVGRTMPRLTMGGSGPLGLPGIDMLVSEKTGREMGLVPNVAVLVNAPGVSPAKVVQAVTKVLGTGTSVLNLHESKYRSPSEGGGASGYLDLYKQAATSCPGLSWTVLAAIGQVESDHGRNAGRSSAGALGPMQFMPATWKAYGVDGDRDGKADIMNPYDAIPGAAKYLCANGAGRGGKQLYNAVWHYNHADWYVQKVLNLAKAYAARYE
ncbi:lytic transglycosylase domain-containing protein [Actinomadura welshii]|uniref:lytic transglycosylase domain-containing protein n=1 Tax=Actinomadura welshii TaxID=3103817 RepID=UPI0003AD2068|nr:lytic transglycosylase domain-containing protein [Actinomadura madurae]